MGYVNDNRIVMTLDAGGTNFVFSAIQAGEEIIEPFSVSSCSYDLKSCLNSLLGGLRKVCSLLPQDPVAISFAFPGPADYENGVIGDLPNFPSFRGGIALKAFLEEKFCIPVYINNDGNLFAYGEALAGALPYVNSCLESVGSNRRYKNLLGITFGTGFGAGVVIDKVLLSGDNGCGGDVWLVRNGCYPNMIAEESVSIRAVKRVYERFAGLEGSDLTPKDIFEIADGKMGGNKNAAVKSFQEFGKVAGMTIAGALNIVDGIVVLGGGITGAAKYFMPSLLEELRGNLFSFSGDRFPVLQMDIFDLSNKREFDSFLSDEDELIKVPDSDRYIPYRKVKKTGILVSSLGTSKAIALGAYTFALTQLDKS